MKPGTGAREWRVGVLALQGDFGAHAQALQRHGVSPVEIRTPGQMEGLDGIVLPGGESTTMLKLLARDSFDRRLHGLIAGGLPTLATCAGVILLAREVLNPRQASLGLLDVTVERNAYGRQLDSAVVALEPSNGVLGPGRVEGVFIRAPRLVRVGPSVEVLARRGGDPVLVRQDRLLAATFHPELSPSDPVVPLFVTSLGGAP